MVLEHGHGLAGCREGRLHACKGRDRDPSTEAGQQVSTRHKTSHPQLFRTDTSSAKRCMSRCVAVALQTAKEEDHGWLGREEEAGSSSTYP